MRTESKKANATYTLDAQRLDCAGFWTVLYVDHLPAQLENIAVPSDKNITISGAKINAFDSAGALMLIRFMERLKKQGP